MARTKITVRWLPQVVVNPQAHICSKNILNRRARNIPFKKKKLLPQSKVAEVKTNGQVVPKKRISEEKTSVSQVEDAFIFN